MKHIAYIIGHRSSDPFRIRNLCLVLKWLLNLRNISKNVALDIVVVEQDEKPTIKNIIDPSINYIFAYNSGEYNRGWAFNIGYIKFFKCDYFFFADNDIIMKNNDMLHVFDTCNMYDAINPYSEIHDTTSKLYDDIESNDISKILHYSYKNDDYIGQKRENICFTGGIVGFSHKSIQKIAGWDERFRGRGYEDYAMTAKMNLFVSNIHVYNNKAIHIWHPWDQSNRLDNENLHIEYSNYKADDYLKLINDSYNEIGCINKYVNESSDKIKYISNESIDNAKNYTHKLCGHCKYSKYSKYINKNNHNYVDGYNTYSEYSNKIKSTHPDTSENDLVKLTYFNLYGRYNCIQRCNIHININSHDYDIDPPS